MKNTILLFAIAMLTSAQLFAQDRLLFLNGDETDVKITEVSSSEVKYKRMNNLEGPTFSTLKSELFMIKYANGDKEIIEQVQTAPAPSPAPATFPTTAETETATLYGSVKNPIHHKKFGNTKEEQLKLCKAKNRQGIALVAIGAGLLYPTSIWNFAILPGTTGSTRAIHLMYGIGGIAGGTAMVVVGALRIVKFSNHKRNLINGVAIAPTMINDFEYAGANIRTNSGAGFKLTYRF